MADIVTEFIRAVVTFVIFGYLLAVRKRADIFKKPGWSLIIGGFSLILFGMLIDLSDNFAALDRFVVVGDTTFEAVFEKVVGYLLGFTLLAFGFWKWLPHVIEVRKSEKDLHCSFHDTRARLDFLLRASPAVTYNLSASDDHTVKFVSDNVMSMLGYTADELLGYPGLWSGRIHPEDAPGIFGEIRSVLENGRHAHEYRFLHKDGSYRWIYDEMRLVRDADGRGKEIVGYLTDITVRKEAEESMRINSKLLENIFSISGLQIAYLDRDFNFIMVNRPYAEANGREVEFFKGKNHFDLFPNEEKESIFRRVVRTGEPYKAFARPFWRPDHPERGITYWDWTFHPVIIASGEVGGFILFLQDVTERMVTQVALQESEKRYRDLFEDSKDVIFTASTSGEILDINPSGVELFGAFSKYELMELNMAEDLFRHREEWDALQQEIEEKSCLSGFETAMTGTNGKRIIANITASAVRNSKGKVVAIRGILRDMTEHKKLEQQLLQAQKMEAIGQLTGGIAHDFNNMLMAIMGYTGILQMKIQADDPLMGNIKRIVNMTEKASALTKRLLAFGRQQDVILTPVDINNVVRKAEDFLARLVGEDVRISTSISKEVLPVLADTSQLEQVLMNLVTNARDAMSEGGLLSITTGVATIDAEFRRAYGYGEPGEYVCVTVADTGAGMDKITCEKIFEPFYTTKDIGKGTGLGLSVVYGIVKQHDGYINVTSDPGKGSEFKVYLPMCNMDVEEEREVPLPKPAAGTETVLVAEDNASVREMVSKILTDHGYKVIEAVDGEDAVNKFKENKDQIELLLLDVVMPGKDGKKAYDEITRMAPGIKALFLSGYTNDIVNRKIVQEKDLEFIHKPVSPITLLARIREILGVRTGTA